MVLSRAFLLIELLASLAIFTIFATLIIRFQAVCNKTTNMALQQASILNLSLTDMELLKRAGDVMHNKQDEKYQTFVEFFTVNAIKDFKLAKVTVSPKSVVVGSKINLISSC